MDWPKWGSETITSIGVGDSWWDERCLIIIEFCWFAVLGESDAWRFSSCCGVCFKEEFPD